MPFTLLKGTFKPAAGTPDGDSVRFAPSDPGPLFTLPRRGRRPWVNQKNGTVQLRFEGIDAMEKGAKEPFASNATKMNLELMGLTSATDEAEGYILTNQIGPNGRLISFVFKGNATEQDGASVYLDVEWLKRSVNFQLLEFGVVYPLFYDTLFADLRTAMATATRQSRAHNVGLWPADKTKMSVIWAGADSLATLDPVFPKLWRRLNTPRTGIFGTNPIRLTLSLIFWRPIRIGWSLFPSRGPLTWTILFKLKAMPYACQLIRRTFFLCHKVKIF